MAARRMVSAAVGLLALASMTSCFEDNDSSDTDNGPGVDTPLLLVGGSGTGGGGGGGGPAPTGAYTFVDELTYPNGHPLSTATTDSRITQPEDDLYNQVIQYRLTLPAPAPPQPPIQQLIHDTLMRKCERAHEKHMAETNFFAVTNPEGDDHRARMTKCGIAYAAAEEVIQMGAADAAAAFQAMVQNPGAQAIISDSRWTKIGCGYWDTQANGKFWGTLFAY